MTSDPPRPDDRGAPELSASLWSQAKIAARGIVSLLKTNEPAKDVPPADVVSPDTLRETRLPPGQVRAKRWPILHVGPTPKVDLATWRLAFTGLVDSPVTFSWEEFRALPSTRVFADMHCVTRWSLLDNTWEGVLVSEVMKRVVARPEARFVLVHAEQGYTTNLPIDEFLGEDCLFAWARDGRDLEPDHGWPLRLIVPRLYAWKSAKWVRGIEFLDRERPGFWEENGYHRHGDPWSQERFS